MNYQDYIYQILGFVGLPAIFSLYLTERVKASVKSTFDHKLEEIKKENTKEIEEVKKEHSKEISKFQSELNYIKSKENFKFTKLHEKRLEVLEKTYYYINETSEALQNYLSPIEFGDEAKNKLANNFIVTTEEFTVYFNNNAIYFDERLEQILKEFFKESFMIFVTYDSDDLINEKMWSYKEFQKNIPPIKKQIEAKFRELLGE